MSGILILVCDVLSYILNSCSSEVEIKTPLAVWGEGVFNSVFVNVTQIAAILH